MSDEGKVPAGYYRGRAIAGSEQYASKKGTDQIGLDLSIPSLNRTFTTFFYFTEKAQPYAIDRLRACGWQGDDVTKLVGIDANEVDVQIFYEVYEGKEQLKVQIATGGGRVKLDNPMSEKEKREFGARVKQSLKGAGAATPARSGNGQDVANRPAPNRAMGEVDDDELPF